ncbi:MAG: amidohydrolase family protein, partial [Candidatus Thorarchaeota archaeon]
MTGSTAIVGGIIVTGDVKEKIVPDGYVRFEGNQITEIGSGKPKKSADAVIDASGCVVIPGLITAHTHLYGILLRGANLGIEPPTDFAQILQRVWWPVDEALTIEDAKASAISASADMLRNGSTFFADTYSGPNSIEGSLNAIAEGTRMTGMRALLAFEMTERNNPEEAERGFNESIQFIKSIEKGDGLVSCMMSLHASFTVNDEIVTKTVQESTKL